MLFDYSAIDANSISGLTDDALARADSLVHKVVAAPRPGTYDAILAPLDQIGDIMVQAQGTAAFMGYVHPDQDVRAAGKEAEERLDKWAVELVFRDDLYEAVSSFAATEEAAGLTGERQRLLAFWMRDLRKAGHELAPEVRADVKEMTNRLVELGVRFQQNIDAYDDALVVTREDLDGLPDSYIQSLEPGEEPNTYRVTMAYPHVVPFMENARKRDLRERLSFKFNSRAADENRPILAEAVRLRHRIATLFSQSSWAEHQLDDRMATRPENVTAFYADLRPPLTDLAKSEIERMSAMLQDDTGDRDLQPWDWRYYDTQLRKTEYGVDPHEVAEYLPLQPVLDGMFRITGDVFGLDYQPVSASAWHEDVITYRILDRGTGRHVSTFYMDLFPREGKFSHAAAFTLVPGRKLPDGSYQRPASAIVANFTKPLADRPSLLQHSEVETLFHEFGHILHQTLTTAELVRFSGTNTERDFVEAPSQIMEHWTWKPEVLALFATHHRSGEPIPADLVSRLTSAKRLNIGLSTLRQMQFGMLDMALHSTDPEPDLDRVVEETTAVSLLPVQEGTFYPASFGHLLGGYDAGYYGYLWSEVYGDDMFSRFETDGVLSPEVGRDYRREVLERGGTRDAIEHLRAFLRREPNNRAFLRDLGIDA